MNAITKDFDVVIQVHESVVNRIASAMHAANAAQHRVRYVYNDQLVDLQIGRPVVSLRPDLPVDGLPRALAKGRALLQFRPLSDAGALGNVGVAHVTIRASLNCIRSSGGDPLLLKYDWSETTSNDITLVGPTGADAADFRDSIAQNLQGLGGTMPTPVTGNAAFRFLSGATGNLAAIGMNFGAGSQGTKDQLNIPFLGADDWRNLFGFFPFIQFPIAHYNDWALALGRDYVLGKILDGMKAQWGELPPPFGTSQVLVSKDKVVCMVEVFGKCLDQETQCIYLEKLDVSLDWTLVKFNGTARAVTSGPWPEASADFTFTASLSIDPSGKLAISLDLSSLNFNEWYAVVFDWLSFGALQDVVKNAFQQALLSDQAQQGLSSLFSSSVLGKLAALGKSVDVNANPQANAVFVMPEAIVFFGAVGVADTSRAPTAGFVILRRASDPDVRVFQAGESWAPGGDLVTFNWDFGDGTVITQNGDDVRLAVEHTYVPGEYTAQLRVTDDAGRMSTCFEVVNVGLLSLEADSWIFGRQQTPIQDTFLVKEGHDPLPGATVTASVPGWQDPHLTGADGRASFSIDPSHFVPLATPCFDPSGDWYLTDSVQIEASKAGYLPESHLLYLADPVLDLNGQDVYPYNVNKFPAEFRVTDPQGPVAGASIVVTGAGSWQLQQWTDAKGSATFMLDPAGFVMIANPGIDTNGFLEFGYITVEASKAGCCNSNIMTVAMGYSVKLSPGSLQGFRHQLEEWWKWPIEFNKGDERVDPAISEAISDVMLALDTLDQIVALGEGGPQVLSVIDVLGANLKDPGFEETMSKHLQEVFSQVDTNIRAVRDAAARASAKKPTPAVKPVARSAHAGWSTRAQGLERTAAAIVQFWPSEKQLPSQLEKAVGLLGRLALLSERHSRVLPVALLLGVGKEDAPRSVARRIDELLSTMGQRLAARLLDGTAVSR